MPTPRNVIETHLKQAQDALQDRMKLLTGRQFDEKRCKRDARVRELQGLVRQFNRRIKAFDKIVAVNQDLVTRRAERAAQPKLPKVKKKKPVAETKPKVKKERKPAAGA